MSGHPAGDEGPVVVGVLTIYSRQSPQLYVDIDRTQCEKLGVDMQYVFDTLQVYMGTYYVNLFNKFGRTWQVNLSAEPKYRTKRRCLKLLKVSNKQGSMVPMGAVATVRPITGPVMVMRYNMYTSAPINGCAGFPRISAGTGALEVGRKAKRPTWRSSGPRSPTCRSSRQGRPSSPSCWVRCWSSWCCRPSTRGGRCRWRSSSSCRCASSRGHGHAIVGMPMDIFVQIGFVVLAGLAAKNAILIVEFARQLQQEGSRSPRRPRGVPVASAADHDDVVRVHLRRGPADLATGPGPKCGTRSAPPCSSA